MLLGALGVGGAFAWQAMSSDDEDTSVAGTTPPATTPPATTPPVNTPPTNIPPATTPPATTPPVTTPPATTPPATTPPATTPPATTPPATTPPATTPPANASKNAPCEVVPHGGEKASKASTGLAKILEARESQFGLCFASRLNKNFEGEMEIHYRWGRNKGPNKIKTTSKNLNDQQVRLCLETIIKSVPHPGQEKSGGAAILEVEASGGDGALKACKITARIPQRGKRGGPKPPGWQPPPGGYYPPGGYGGYGGGY